MATPSTDKAQDAPKVASSKVVKYVGTADIREIDVAGWKNADVEDQKKMVWNKRNNWAISVEEFSESALVYLDEIDDGFVIMDAPTK